MNDLNASLLKSIRLFIWERVKELGKEQWEAIPSGFSNNIQWNLGHLIATQQILHYKRSGLPTVLPEPELAPYRKGTSPKNWKETPSRQFVEQNFLAMCDRFEEDYNKDLFKSFESYTTSSGILLNNIEDSYAFNLHHEGIHLGTISVLVKFL